MRLHEYQAKKLLARYGVPIPRGEVATTPQEARQIATRLGGKMAIKAQVLVGGRGKAGGIKIAADPDLAEAAMCAILGTTIKGAIVHRALVEEAMAVSRELYLGLVIDRSSRRIVIMASAEGGVEIEEVAARSPDKIVRLPVDPFLGLRPYQTRGLAAGISLDSSSFPKFATVAQGLYDCFLACDASLVEVNPLAVTREGHLLALDAKILLDDNALDRHPDLAASRDAEEELYESEARKHGLSYVKLDGEIGCLVNGAGLAMAVMDIIELYGGAPANFLDIGGGARAERVAAALRIILADQNVRAVLINILGGITRCDEVARGIVGTLAEVRPSLPIVVRLVGTNEEEGRRILAQADVITATTLSEAAQKAVAAARRGRGRVSS